MCSFIDFMRHAPFSGATMFSLFQLQTGPNGALSTPMIVRDYLSRSNLVSIADQYASFHVLLALHSRTGYFKRILRNIIILNI